MKKRGELFEDAPCRASVLSKAHGKIVIDWPRGVPVRLLPDIAKLVFNHIKRTATRGEAQARREGRAAPHFFLTLYRRGCNREAILELARKALKGKDQRILVNSLQRPKKFVKLSEIDLAICLLDHEKKLTGCTRAERLDRVVTYLREHGFGNAYKIEFDAYRRREKRLHDIGLKLQIL